MARLLSREIEKKKNEYDWLEQTRVNPASIQKVTKYLREKESYMNSGITPKQYWTSRKRRYRYTFSPSSELHGYVLGISRQECNDLLCTLHMPILPSTIQLNNSLRLKGTNSMKRTRKTLRCAVASVLEHFPARRPTFRDPRATPSRTVTLTGPGNTNYSVTLENTGNVAWNRPYDDEADAVLKLTCRVPWRKKERQNVNLKRLKTQKLTPLECSPATFAGAEHQKRASDMYRTSNKKESLRKTNNNKDSSTEYNMTENSPD